jgi:hypothetical protein
VSADEELPPSAEERVLRAHLERAKFVAGAREGRWRLLSLEWPVALVGVSAAERISAPREFFLRIDLSGYPRQAPNGYPWDVEADALLATDGRPKGGRVERAFRADWQGLYLPVDRSALDGHSAWRSWRWDDSKDLTYYLRLVHELLNDDDYTGV